MNAIQKQANAIAAFRPSPDLSAVFEVMASGVPLIARDLTPERVAEAERIASAAEQILAPASPAVVAAWVQPITAAVKNAPSGDGARLYAMALADTCESIPAGAFTNETRRAWLRTGDAAQWWPSVAELYQHLSRYGERIRAQVQGARRFVRAAERMRENEQARTPPTDAERAEVAAKAAAFRAEVAAREAEEARIRKWGTWMPEGAESLAGRALVEALRRALPGLSGDQLAVTEGRITEMERTIALVEQMGETA